MFLTTTVSKGCERFLNSPTLHLFIATISSKVSYVDSYHGRKDHYEMTLILEIGRAHV